MDKIKSQIEELKKQLQINSEGDELYQQRENCLLEAHTKIRSCLFRLDPNMGNDGIYLYNPSLETFQKEKQISGHIDVVFDGASKEHGTYDTEFNLILSFGPKSFQQFVNAESFQAHFPKGEELEEMFAVDLERKKISIQLF